MSNPPRADCQAMALMIRLMPTSLSDACLAKWQLVNQSNAGAVFCRISASSNYRYLQSGLVVVRYVFDRSRDNTEALNVEMGDISKSRLFDHKRPGAAHPET